MKAALAAVCVCTAAAGCWLGVMEMVLRHPGFPQRIVIAALIAVQSVLTLIVISGSSHRLWRTLIATGACGFLTLGSLAIMRNVTGPHFEGFAVVIGLALIVQALLTLWDVFRGASVVPATR